jgi:hypothetical protein
VLEEAFPLIEARMAFPMPSLETIKVAFDYGKQYFSIWISVLRSPIEVVKNIDLSSADAIAESLKFLAFVYVVDFFVQLPEYTSYYVNLKNWPVMIAVELVSFILLALSVTALFHFVAYWLRGRGTFSASFIACAYLSAFCPFLSVTDYAFLLFPDIGKVGKADDLLAAYSSADLVTRFAFTAIVVLVCLFFTIYLLPKVIPLIKYVHAVGTLRALLIFVTAFPTALLLTNDLPDRLIGLIR